jgi:cellulose synthase (UDP-forming)
MGRAANLSYLARTKVKGVPHHAKAGNINSALLKESEGSSTFVLVLDCDMTVHPDFLQNILGHFYKQVNVVGVRVWGLSWL